MLDDADGVEVKRERMGSFVPVWLFFGVVERRQDSTCIQLLVLLQFSPYNKDALVVLANRQLLCTPNAI